MPRPKCWAQRRFDDDARDQGARAGVDVGHPLRERAAAARGARTGHGAPARLLVALQHLDEALRRDLLLLVHVAAREDMRLFIEVGEAAVVGVVLERLESLRGHEDRRHLRLRLRREVIGDGLPEPESFRGSVFRYTS